MQKKHTIEVLYKRIFVDRKGTLEDCKCLQKNIYALTSAFLKRKDYPSNYPFRSELLDYCHLEVVTTMAKVSKKIPPSDIIPYSCKVIDNSINRFQKKLYVKNNDFDPKAPDELPVNLVSLDQLFSSKNCESVSISYFLSDSKNVELDILTQSIFEDIRKKYKNPKAVDWFILEAKYGYSRTMIADMYHISSSYVGREINRFIEKTKKSHGEQLRDCLNKYQEVRIHDF